MLFWDLERPLKRLTDDYLNSTDPDATALIIEIDLPRDKFEYRHISRLEAAAQEQQEAVERKSKKSSSCGNETADQPSEYTLWR